MPSSKTYTQLISQAINDFDSIFSALLDRHASNVEGQVLVAEDLSNGQVATSAYAGLVRQLYRVGEITKDGNTITGITAITPTTVDGIIRSYANRSNPVSDGVYGTPTSNKLTVEYTIPNAGYYDTNSTLLGHVSFADINVTADNVGTYAVVDNNVTSYEVRNLDSGVATNIPMLKVTMPKGSVDVTFGNVTKDDNGGEAIHASVSINSGSSTATAASMTATDNSIQYFTINLHQIADYSVRGSIAVNVAKSAGFITNADVTTAPNTFNIAASMTADDSQTIYIPPATITSPQLASGSSLTITGDSVLDLTDQTPGSLDNYYALTTTASNLNVTSTTTAGYVAAGTGVSLGRISDITNTYYIPKGIVPDTTISLTTSELTYTDNSSMVSSSQTPYAITYGVSGGAQGINKTVTTNITKGFVNDTAYDVTVSGTNTIYIKEATVSQTPQITSTGATGDTSIIAPGTSGHYKITLPLESTVSPTFTAGYLSNANQFTNNTGNASYSFSVAKGSVSATPRLGVVLTDNSDGKDGSALDESIFLEELPAGYDKDYYTVTASIDTPTVSSGYITSSDVTVASPKTFYIKKATFKYVEQMGDSESSFLEVTNGGYVPSGTIASIAEISGSIDAAAVVLAFSDSNNGIISSTQENGKSYYAIEVNKAQTGSNAGYISDNSGTANGTTYVLHGSESLATTFNSTTAGTVSALNSTNHTYNVPLTSEITNNLTFSEGYIKQSDITLNGTGNVLTKTLTGNTSIDVAEGAYGITTSATSFTLTATRDSELLLGTGVSDGYALVPQLAATIKVDATAAGYIKPDDQDVTYNYSNTDESLVSADPIYIKKGTGPVTRTGYASANNWSTAAQTPLSNYVNITNNFSSTVNGDYTISVGGYVEASLELDPGYYGSNEKTLTGGQVFVNKSTTVTHGHADITLTASNQGLSLADSSSNPISGALLSSSTQDGNYVTINSTGSVSGAVNSQTFVTGYMKDGDISFPSSEVVSSTAYIRTVPLTVTTLDGAAHDYNTTSGNNISSGTTIYGIVTIGSNDGDIHGSSTFATGTLNEAGLRDAVILPTANRFSLYNTEIQLTANAMGSNVVDKLQDLEARLAGTYSAS